MKSAAPASVPLTIVVPVFNRWDKLQFSLEKIFASPGIDPFVCVVDDGSTFPGEIPKNDRVKHIRLPANRGPAAARNAGAAGCPTDLIAFVDCDVFVKPDALAGLCRIVAAGKADCASGVYSPHSLTASWIGHYKHLYLLSCLPPIPGPYFIAFASLMVISRSAFERAGGFDERYRHLEDMDFSYRLNKLGAKVFLEPNAEGDHDHPIGLFELLSMDFFRGLNFVQLWFRHRAWKIHLPPHAGSRLNFVVTALGFPWAVALLWAKPVAGLFLLVLSLLINARFIGAALRHTPDAWQKLSFPIILYMDMLFIGLGAYAGAFKSLVFPDGLYKDHSSIP